MATTRDSALYTKLHVNKYVGDARDFGGRAVPVPFDHTVVSGETGGASAGVQDLVNLCVLPAHCMVVGIEIAHGALGASAGAGRLLDIGDVGDPDRFVAGLDVDVTTTGLVFQTSLALTGQNYRPTAETIVQGRWRGGNPVVGQRVVGNFFIVPGA